MIPVITIDGPSGSGKGALCMLLLQTFKNWYLLDSGSLYRAVALRSQELGIDVQDEDELSLIALNLPVSFKNDEVFLEDKNVTNDIRASKISRYASVVATFPKVRESLLHLQKSFKKAPGLIADGRDMGTIVFPDAQVKIFLTASDEVRAKRRFMQAHNTNKEDLEEIFKQMAERDKRDTTRKASPLKAAEDALVIESTNLTLEQVQTMVFEHLRSKNYDSLAPWL